MSGNSTPALEQETVPTGPRRRVTVAGNVWAEYTEAGAVQFGIGTTTEALLPSGARKLAAALAELADEAEAAP